MSLSDLDDAPMLEINYDGRRILNLTQYGWIVLQYIRTDKRAPSKVSSSSKTYLSGMVYVE